MLNSMFRIVTQDEGQIRQLEQDCLSSNGCLLGSSSHAQLIIEMVRSITYEYFHTDLPLLASKVKEFTINALGMTYSLTLFRDIMNIIRKQTDLLAFYQGYLIAMNRQLSFQDFTQEPAQSMHANDQIIQEFQITVQQRSSIRDHIAQSQLQLESKIEVKAETTTQKSEKTMQSQIMEAESSYISSNPLNKFSQFIKNSFTDSPPQSINKISKKLNDSSQELKVFQKKGGSVMQNNIEVLMRSQIEEDLKREVTSQRSQFKHAEVQQFRYNRLIKDSLMNSKLKLRRKRK